MTKQERAQQRKKLSKEYSKARRRARERVYSAKKTGIDVDISILPNLIDTDKARLSTIEKAISKLNSLGRKQIISKASSVQKKSTKIRKQKENVDILREELEDIAEDEEREYQSRYLERPPEYYYQGYYEDVAYIDEALNVINSLEEDVNSVVKGTVRMGNWVIDSRDPKYDEYIDHKSELAESLLNTLEDIEEMIKKGDSRGSKYAQMIEANAQELKSAIEDYLSVFDSKQPNFISESAEYSCLSKIEMILFNTVKDFSYQLNISNYNMENSIYLSDENEDTYEEDYNW